VRNRVASSPVRSESARVSSGCLRRPVDDRALSDARGLARCGPQLLLHHRVADAADQPDGHLRLLVAVEDPRGVGQRRVLREVVQRPGLVERVLRRRVVERYNEGTQVRAGRQGDLLVGDDLDAVREHRPCRHGPAHGGDGVGEGVGVAAARHHPEADQLRDRRTGVGRTGRARQRQRQQRDRSCGQRTEPEPRHQLERVLPPQHWLAAAGEQPRPQCHDREEGRGDLDQPPGPQRAGIPALTVPATAQSQPLTQPLAEPLRHPRHRESTCASRRLATARTASTSPGASRSARRWTTTRSKPPPASNWRQASTVTRAPVSRSR